MACARVGSREMGTEGQRQGLQDCSAGRLLQPGAGKDGQGEPIVSQQPRDVAVRQGRLRVADAVEQV